MSETIKRFPKVTPQSAWKLDVDQTLALQDAEEEGDDPTMEVYIPHPDLIFEDAAEAEFMDEDTQVFERPKERETPGYDFVTAPGTSEKGDC